MIKQIRILEIIIICILVKVLYGKPVNKIQEIENKEKNERTKRGYSHYGGNDFGSSVHVSSGVLQYSGDNDHLISSDAALHVGHSESLDLSSLSADHASSIGSSGYLESSAANADPWSASGISSGYDVWLEPLPDYHSSSALDSSSVHSTSISSTHSGSDHIASTVFSDGSSHSAYLQLPSSQLHTNIASSNAHDHDTFSISDNIDFNNIADTNTKHYAKSYGK